MKVQVEMRAFCWRKDGDGIPDRKLGWDGTMREVDLPEEELSPVPAPNDDEGKKAYLERVLGRIFYWGQNDFQPQQKPSLSVGDVIILANQRYRIDNTGFTKMGAMKSFNVYINKYYFPKDLWPKTGFTEVFEDVIKIRADSRTDAALRVWAKHGQRWLNIMSPQVRGVSLNVGRAQREWALEVGRLTPVPVLSALRKKIASGEGIF